MREVARRLRRNTIADSTTAVLEPLAESLGKG